MKQTHGSYVASSSRSPEALVETAQCNADGKGPAQHRAPTQKYHHPSSPSSTPTRI
ncbi:hypothetical protein LTR28_007749 [Elasticomyces elasticus]|nr:hypothetical protein LTR28_007749 [Elasticomyces elasticus]